MKRAECCYLLRCQWNLSVTLNSSLRLDLAGDVPDESRELARDRHTDFVQRQLTGREMAVSLCESQLRLPCNRPYTAGLALLTHLQGSAHAGGEAVVPRRLHQHSAGVSVAGLGDGSL